MNFDKTISELFKCRRCVSSSSCRLLKRHVARGCGSSNVDLEIAAAGNTEVMRAKMKTMGMLGLNDIIDDILITLGEQYHLLRPLQKHDGLFLYHVLDKSKSNLALARRALREAEKNLV